MILKHKGIDLRIVGTYHPEQKGDLETQPLPEEFEVEKVYVKDIDIFPLLDWEVIFDISQQVLKLRRNEKN